MKKTLLEIYEAAKENAKMNDLLITSDYIKEYATNAYSALNENYALTEAQAELILSCHQNYKNNEQQDSNSYYHLIEKELQNHLV